MAFPTTLLEKKNATYIWFANAVASEAPTTPSHAERLVIAKSCAGLTPPFDAYVTIDFLTQGYDDSTPLNTVETRFSGLATNLIALGFGG